tara:strand:- start:139 stop:558 length:420 start_codon:yes stop_codon:yes gene_type:complete
MTRNELLEYHDELCKQAKDLMSLKNRDYAGNDGLEPFANFTRVESMGICSTEQGFMTRITDKMSRLSSFLSAGKMHVQDEGFNDTVIDVINYMVLLSAYIGEKTPLDIISDIDDYVQDSGAIGDEQLLLFEETLDSTEC